MGLILIKEKLKKRLSKRHWNKKINRISQNEKIKKRKLTDLEKNKVLNFWKDFRPLDNLKWHNTYMAIYENSNEYNYEFFIPEDVFYMEIEPSLNNHTLAKAYEDKNFYHSIFEKKCMPNIVLRNINGNFYDQEYTRIENTRVKKYLMNHEGVYIVKPSLDTQGGKNIKKLIVNNDNIEFDGIEYQNIDILSRYYNKDFLIQEIIEQHEVLADIYKHSLNTIRIVTLRDKDKIICGSAVIRFGNEKRIVDNKGIACGIDVDGKINYYATYLDMSKCNKHPYTNANFSGVQIPNYSGLKDLVRSLHSKLLYFDLVSWDIAIDKNGNFKMVEFNLKGQEINFHQINNGPLLGQNTKTLLEKVYRK
ncbi:hypothetical protein OBCHQ24_15475 [Oceanobacillus iheyensis]|nr:hypothetical protein OBCHQ24_15475 [Oceanobacillus iheyensis]